MSEILIKGMDLPKEGRVSLIAVFSNGDVKYIDSETFSSFYLPQKAIEVPTHGRLGDLDLVEEWMRKKHKDNDCPFDIDAFLFALRKIPTVLEAST